MLQLCLIDLMSILYPSQKLTVHSVPQAKGCQRFMVKCGQSRLSCWYPLAVNVQWFLGRKKKILWRSRLLAGATPVFQIWGKQTWLFAYNRSNVKRADEAQSESSLLKTCPGMNWQHTLLCGASRVIESRFCMSQELCWGVLCICCENGLTSPWPTDAPPLYKEKTETLFPIWEEWQRPVYRDSLDTSDTSSLSPFSSELCSCVLCLVLLLFTHLIEPINMLCCQQFPGKKCL